MSDPLQTTLDCIEDLFSDKLVSLVMFGSYGQKKDSFKIASDVDFLILLKGEIEDQDVLSRKIKHRLRYPFPLPAFNIYSVDDFPKILQQNPWLVLSVREGYRVTQDDGGYFESCLNKAFTEIKHEKLGVLAWHIKDLEYPHALRKHYRWAALAYERAAETLHDDGMFVVALDNLSRAVHAFMIDKLFKRGISMTTGEITQMFFNVYADKSIRRHFNVLLQLEQKTGQNYSFGFNRNGVMAFNDKETNKLRLVYQNCLDSYRSLQEYFKYEPTD